MTLRQYFISDCLALTESTTFPDVHHKDVKEHISVKDPAFASFRGNQKLSLLRYKRKKYPSF